MKIKALVGAGDRIVGFWLPFVVVGIVANILWPGVFAMRFGRGGAIAGIVLLVLGLPLWLVSVGQVLVIVPKGRLITAGPYRLVLHPLYTSVAILVVPGCGLLLDTWVGFVIGAALYAASRIYAPGEEHTLAELFGEEYAAYRSRVLLPWV